MGIYCKLGCDEKKQSIDPFVANSRAIKFPVIATQDSPFSYLALFAMGSYNFWDGLPCRLITDFDDDGAYFDYEDITAAVINEYNAIFGSNIEIRLRKGIDHAQ